MGSRPQSSPQVMKFRHGGALAINTATPPYCQIPKPYRARSEPRLNPSLCKAESGPDCTHWIGTTSRIQPRTGPGLVHLACSAKRLRTTATGFLARVFLHSFVESVTNNNARFWGTEGRGKRKYDLSLVIRALSWERGDLTKFIFEHIFV